MQPTLFKLTTRDDRQEECRVKWIKNKCKGSIVASTGFGFDITWKYPVRNFILYLMKFYLYLYII